MTSRRWTPRPGPALAGLVVALVLGILGMHALSLGHASGSGSAASQAMPAMPGMAAGAHHQAHVATSAVAARSGVTVHEDDDPMSMGDMVMLCALMLAGAGGLLLLLLVRRAAASSYGRVPRSAAHTPWLAIAQTSTGPPGDLAYVVVRC